MDKGMLHEKPFSLGEKKEYNSVEVSLDGEWDCAIETPPFLHYA